MVTRRSVLLPLACFLASGVVTARAQDTTTVDSTRAPAPVSFIVRNAGRVTLGGSLLARLPIDDPRQALHLAPGVVLRGAALAPFGATQATIRGGGTVEPSAYLDGAPVRLLTFGTQQLTLPPFMVSEVSVETGVTDGATGDARGGLVSYSTPTGGAQYRGRFRAETDEAFGDGAAVGYNRFEGAVGGPVPGLENLTFFTALHLQGQRSHYRGMGAADQPTYVIGGLDTTVQLSDGSGGMTTVLVPSFTQWSGDCDGCVGLRRPMDWATQARLLGKVAYDYGAGSRVSVTALAAGFQERYFPGARIAAPSLYEGTHAWSRLVVLDAHHRLGDAGAPMLRVNLSYATDRAISGPLATESELDSREPGLGIGLTPLQFAGLEVFPFPVAEQIVRNFRTNTGLRAPYLDREDLRNSQPYRLNPFGLQSGWPTTGLDAQLTARSERRLHGRIALEWTPWSPHRFTAGVEADVTDLSYYRSNLLRQAFADVMVVAPRAAGAFVADRVTLGRAELELGVRYDRVKPGGWLPDVPGRIFSHPAWDDIDADYGQSVADVMTEARTQEALLPRARLSFRPGERTVLRLGFGQHLAAPPYADLFANANSDLAFTNTFAGFGRDVDLARVTMIEAGVQHAVRGGLSFGLSGYRRTPRLAHGDRLFLVDDPLNPGDQLVVIALAKVDDGDVLGFDAHLAWDRGSGIAAWAGYSFAVGRPDDIPVGPVPIDPPNLSSHQVSAVLSATVPRAWKASTALGRIFQGVEGVAVFRAVSGLPYTRFLNVGSGQVVPAPDLVGSTTDPPNSSRLPWTKHLDLRVTRRARVGSWDWTVYADVRNVLGIRNTEALFVETGDVRNDLHRTRLLSSESANLMNEAQSNGALMSGSTVDVRGCGTWSDPVNCVALSRVERRFGDGDGLYTRAEQDRALNAFYDAFLGPWWFYGPGRTARVGLEVAF